MRLLVDMNLSPGWVAWLASAGIEAVHWSTVGPTDASDRDIMGYAKRHDRVVLTHDLDFGAILAASNGEKPSVVPIRAENVSPRVIGKHVVGALLQIGGRTCRRSLADDRTRPDALAPAAAA